MSIEQIKTISGSIYQKYDTFSQEYKENRMPRVGQICEFEDGQRYIFVSTEVDIAVGQVVANVLSDELTVETDYASGVREITVDATGVAANQYQDGYILLNNKYNYRIKSNTASVSSVITVKIYEPLCEAISEDDSCFVTPFEAKSVIVGTASNNSLGVAIVASTAATENKINYIWVQTHGIGAVKVTTGATALDAAALMADAAGALVIASAGNPILAFSLVTTADAVGDGELVTANLCFPR